MNKIDSVGEGVIRLGTGLDKVSDSSAPSDGLSVIMLGNYGQKIGKTPMSNGVIFVGGGTPPTEAEDGTAESHLKTIAILARNGDLHLSGDIYFHENSSDGEGGISSNISSWGTKAIKLNGNPEDPDYMGKLINLLKLITIEDAPLTPEVESETEVTTD